MADFSSFESCSASVSARRSVSNCSRTGPSTASSRTVSSSVLRLWRTCTCRVMSSSVESIVISGHSSAKISSIAAAASRRPFGAIRSRTRSPCELLSSAVSDGSSHFGLPACSRELHLRLAEPLDLLVRELERLEQLVLGDLGGAGLDHRQPVERADDDQVEGRLLLGLLQRRVDDELAVDQPHPHRADRPGEGQRRDHQRRRGPVDAEDVVRGDEVGREDGADHLHLVPEALRPERPDRAVDHARGQDRPLGRAPLALEEAAGDLPGGVHPLLDVDGQREEVRALARLHPALGGREHHRLAGADDDGAVGLLGQLAGLEADFLVADGQRDRGQAVVDEAGPTLSSTPLATLIRIPPLFVESGGLSQRRPSPALAQTSTLRIFGVSPTSSGRAP